MADIADRARAQARRRQEERGLGLDFTKEGSSELAQKARNQRDASLRSRFVQTPWRGADGRLHGGAHNEYGDVSPELAGGLRTTRAAYIDPTDRQAMAADKRLAESEKAQYQQQASSTPNLIGNDEDVVEGSQADYSRKMKALLDAQILKDRAAREQEKADEEDPFTGVGVDEDEG